MDLLRAAEALLPLFVFHPMAKQLPDSNRDRTEKRPGQIYLHRNRRVRIPDGFIAVGMITSAHGLRGEVKVELHTDFPERFAPEVTVYLGEELDQVTISSARPHQGQMLLIFHGIESRAGAEAVRSIWVCIPEEEAVDLEEDTFVVHDIRGLSVQTSSGQILGTVGQVLFTGANDVYIIETPDEPHREILLPAIAEVIKKVDLENGILTVELLPGLLDE
jgi:16S rRNA processing protein RimM